VNPLAGQPGTEPTQAFRRKMERSEPAITVPPLGFETKRGTNQDLAAAQLPRRINDL
jgi:hypothetical protein